MAIVKLPLDLKSLKSHQDEYQVLRDAEIARESVLTFIAEERYMDALERSIAIMRDMREFPDFSHPEFRTLLAAILFDLAEIHFFLKDYKQSEKELETLFKVVGRLVKEDPDRFGEFHILALELAARILRSRKKVVETLRKEKLNSEALLEKVNSGVASATERLVDSLRKVGELVAATGAYKESLKFYADAIKFAKKRSGRVDRKVIKMTIEMAEIMSRIKSMRPRAKRLLSAVLPHAIALETIELEENINAMMEMIDNFEESPSKWKAFMHAVTLLNRKKFKDSPTSDIQENPDDTPSEDAITAKVSDSENAENESDGSDSSAELPPNHHGCKKQEKSEKKKNKKDKKKDK